MSTCAEKMATWSFNVREGLASYAACPCNDCNMTACVDNARHAVAGDHCECGHARAQHGSQQHGQESPGIPRFEHPCKECECTNFHEQRPVQKHHHVEYLDDNSGISDAEFDRLIHEVD